VPRFLTPEWVDAFNRAMADVRLPPAADDAGLVARSGRFAVAEQVDGGPDGPVLLLLRVEAGRVELSLAASGPDPAVDAGEGSVRPDVTIVVAYDDAAAMAKGELTPADALTAGRIRVRGDLSVLAAGQQVLAEARRHTGSLAAETTY
jgi:hypothetical protein